MSEAAANLIAEIAAPSQRELLWRRIRAHKGLLIGASMIVLVALVAVIAPWLTR